MSLRCNLGLHRWQTTFKGITTNEQTCPRCGRTRIINKPRLRLRRPR